MKKISLKDILSIPQLSFYIAPENISLFLKKKSELRKIFIKIQDITSDKLIDNSELIVGGSSNLSDIMVTRLSSETNYQVFQQESAAIVPEQLLLYQAAVAKTILEDIEKAEKGNNINSELAYSNGEILSIINGKINWITDSGEPLNLSKIKNDLAEGILIANQMLLSESNKNLVIQGGYKTPGANGSIKNIQFSKKDLEEVAKSDLILHNIDEKRIRRND